MDSDHQKALRKLRKKLVRDERGLGEVSSVDAAVDAARTPQQRDDLAASEYEAAKKACANGDFSSARIHFSAVERLTPSDKEVRGLNSQRLTLLRRRPVDTKVSGSFGPGTVQVAGLGRVVVLGRYEARGQRGGLTDAVLLLKKAPEELEDVERSARQELVGRLGLLLWDALRRSKIAPLVDLLVPIPPDFERYSSRLYHPPAAIAESLSKYSTIPTRSDVLVKVRPTKSLRGLSGRSEREAELRESMAVAEDRSGVLKGRSLVVVDDVVTYGTHFREAQRVLVEAGAEQVHAIALTTAHGHPRSLDS